MRQFFFAFMVGGLCLGSATAAPSDVFCLKVGELAESNARVMEAGGTEQDIKDYTKRIAPKRTKMPTDEEIKKELANERLFENVARYVFTVKLDSKSARLVGYKKCLAGDFSY